MVDEIIKERMLRELKKSLKDKYQYDDPFMVLRELYLEDPMGNCIPDKYLGDDVLMDIESKFYYFFDAIRNEFETYENENSFIYVYVVPCYDDDTTSLVILEDRVLYKDNQKAWNFWFESEEKLMDEMYSVYLTLKYKLEKKWCCYELSEIDIQEVAEHEGLDLEGLDLDDVIPNIKKGIEWALDNRDEIIEDAIRDARRNQKDPLPTWKDVCEA